MSNRWLLPWQTAAPGDLFAASFRQERQDTAECLLNVKGSRSRIGLTLTLAFNYADRRCIGMNRLGSSGQSATIPRF